MKSPIAILAFLIDAEVPKLVAAAVAAEREACARIADEAASAIKPDGWPECCDDSPASVAAGIAQSIRARGKA